MNSPNNLTISPMMACPKFDVCNAPICPLDPEQNGRVALPNEPKCTLSKSKRLKLAAGFDFPMHGLTNREYAARCRQQSLSADARQHQLNNLIQSRVEIRYGERR